MRSNVEENDFKRGYYTIKGRRQDKAQTGRHARLGRYRRRYTDGVRDRVQLHRRGEGGLRKRYQHNRFQGRFRRGGGFRPRHTARFQQQGAAVQLGAYFLRAVRRRQIQQQQRIGQLPVRDRHERSGRLRHAVHERIYERALLPRGLCVFDRFQRG